MNNNIEGKVVVITGASHKVGPGSAVYAATNNAVRALSEGLRQEVKPYNIRTRRRGYKRDPVPAHAPGAVTRS